MNTTSPTLSPARATAILAERDRLLQVQADWRAEAREDARQGFRPHYCIHGMNMWTDYDPICGGCEDGTFTQWTDGTDLLVVARDNVDIMARARNASIASAVREVRPWFDVAIECADLLDGRPLSHAFRQVMGRFANPRR